MIKHQDFGEKIGGARKDLWAERGLTLADLVGMTPREIEAYVVKKNVWPVPDYASMVEDGMPVSVAWFRKTVRDALNASPHYFRSDTTPEKRQERQEQYIETVGELKALTEAVETAADAAQLRQKFFIDGGYVEVRHLSAMSIRPTYSTTEKGSENPVITNKLFRAVTANNCAAQFEVDMMTQADRKGFLQKKSGQKAAASRSPRKKRYVPEQLKHVRREGPDYRGGREIIGQNYLDTFGFRGGEFGNWMTQNDRQGSLNMGYDALLDLAEVLGISNKDISLGGKLAIAFGARGHGNAVAHYEPLRTVINLTKMKGAGALAHEFWHAADDFIGDWLGERTHFATKRPGAWEPIKKLVDTMRYKTDENGNCIVTDFAKKAQELDWDYSKERDYWSSNIEMSARAFECYVFDRLSGVNDYLCGSAGAADGMGKERQYPMGEEREAINAVFDEIFAALKETGVFSQRTDADRPKPQKAPRTWDAPTGAQMQLSFF